MLGIGEPGPGLHRAEWHAEAQRRGGDVSDETGKFRVIVMLLHALQEFAIAAHLLGEGGRVPSRHAAHELDRRRGHDRGKKLVLELAKILMGNDQANSVFARLVEKLSDAFVKIILRLIDIEVRCRSLVGRQLRPVLVRPG